MTVSDTDIISLRSPISLLFFPGVAAFAFFYSVIFISAYDSNFLGKIFNFSFPLTQVYTL